MNNPDLLTRLDEVLKTHDAVYRISSIRHVYELESRIHQIHSEGFFDEAFFRDRLSCFHYDLPEDYKRAGSLFIVAVSQPTFIIKFGYKGKIVPVTLPPTYDQGTDAVIKKALESVLNPAGYSVTRAGIPEKTLAVFSGLMQYGRNNIAYLPDKGSFHRPVAFFSDIPCTEDHWGMAVMMERCSQCRACVHACPTNAISADRFLAHAERCITAHNERLNVIPDYVRPEMHHCLLGCMVCQRICPENRKFVDRTEVRESFTEEETTLLMEGVPLEKLEAGTRQKLARLYLEEDYFVVARNLGFLLN